MVFQYSRDNLELEFRCRNAWFPLKRLRMDRQSLNVCFLNDERELSESLILMPGINKKIIAAALMKGNSSSFEQVADPTTFAAKSCILGNKKAECHQASRIGFRQEPASMMPEASGKIANAQSHRIHFNYIEANLILSWRILYGFC